MLIAAHAVTQLGSIEVAPVATLSHANVELLTARPRGRGVCVRKNAEHRNTRGSGGTCASGITQHYATYLKEGARGCTEALPPLGGGACTMFMTPGAAWDP